jgi:hypothetical protein
MQNVLEVFYHLKKYHEKQTNLWLVLKAILGSQLVKLVHFVQTHISPV